MAVFATLYQDHIALEESLIYPAARRQFAADAVNQQMRLAGQAGAADGAIR